MLAATEMHPMRIGPRDPEPVERPARSPVQPVDEAKLISIKQFAALSGLGVRTLERFDAHGQLPRRVPVYDHTGRLLRLKRWSRRSVEDWIRRRGDRVKVAI